MYVFIVKVFFFSTIYQNFQVQKSAFTKGLMDLHIYSEMQSLITISYWACLKIWLENKERKCFPFLYNAPRACMQHARINRACNLKDTLVDSYASFQIFLKIYGDFSSFFLSLSLFQFSIFLWTWITIKSCEWNTVRWYNFILCYAILIKFNLKTYDYHINIWFVITKMEKKWKYFVILSKMEKWGETLCNIVFFRHFFILFSILSGIWHRKGKEVRIWKKT